MSYPRPVPLRGDLANRRRPRIEERGNSRGNRRPARSVLTVRAGLRIFRCRAMSDESHTPAIGLRALWAVWPVEVRVLFGALEKPVFIGLFGSSVPSSRDIEEARDNTRDNKRLA